jgi:hypothetical protein
MSEVMFNHGKRRGGSDTYYSPQWVVDGLPIMFKGKDFFDPCPGKLWNHIKAPIETPKQNTLKGFPIRVENALTYRWRSIAPYSYVNPPFSKMQEWIEKAALEAGHGHISLWFTKLDFRTEWGQLLVDRAAWVIPKMGYVRYLNEYRQENHSATFQTGFALFCCDDAQATIMQKRLTRTYSGLYLPRVLA